MFNATNLSISQVSTRQRGYRSGTAVKALALALSLLGFSACNSDPRSATAAAQRVTERSQLIGGPTGLGEVGDYLLENDQIRLIIQDLSYNRGSGIFGGSLIDADLVRSDAHGNPLGGNGRDSFGELFPAFFLEMIDPENIEVINDGSDGEAAIVEVQGRGGEFITMLRAFNQIMVNSYSPDISGIIGGKPANSEGIPLVSFATRYILEPGARHVRIESTITNNAVSGSLMTFPNQKITPILATATGIDFSTFTIPAGHVIGFGARNKLFSPGIGFDLRFGLEAEYQQPLDLPALPGHITNLLATTNGDGLSYGFASASDPDSNFIYQKKEYYGEDVQPDDMLLLFYASGFAAAFTSEIPTKLASAYCDKDKSAAVRCDEINAQCHAEEQGDRICDQQQKSCLSQYNKCLKNRYDDEIPTSYTFTNYFIVGDGDVASVRDEHYRLKNQTTHLVQGRVIDQASGNFVAEKLNVLIYKAGKNKSCDKLGPDPSLATPFSQALTDNAGNFQFRLEAGDYCYRTNAKGRPTSDAVAMNVSGDTYIKPVAKGAGRIDVTVANTSGQPLPAKLTVVKSYTPQAGKKPNDYLFDLAAGESWRTAEFVDYDENDLSPRRVIEDITFADASGKAQLRVPPGKYTVYLSRGTEYELDTHEIDVKPGGVATIAATLERTVRPEGYMSGDFHMHAYGSIDSGLDYNTRVISVAAEGVDLVVATDHNFISDYEPYILNNQLQPWLKSTIGLELTTFEGGHFNAFPLKRDISSMNRGSIAWQERPPQEIFDELRGMGSLGPDKTIIQVNHPRDSLLGYFSQHNVDGFIGEAELSFKKAAEGDELIAAVTTPSGRGFIQPCEDDPKQSCSTFSWDFDVIEAFNGKRLEMLHHFRMPYDPNDLPQHLVDYFTSDDPEKQLELDEQRDALPPKGTILCNKNEIAFPGGLDDWYNTLNYPRPDGTYKRYAVTGNSDSHQAAAPGEMEPGYPRNYFYVGHNDVEKLTDIQLVDAVQNHHMIVTNGPFINMKINNQPLGSMITTKDSTVAVTLSAAAATWVGEKFTYKLIANGETVAEGPIQLKDHKWEETITVNIDKDTWFVVEVSGENNLFPVLQPDDTGRTNIDAALGSLSASFGLGSGVPGLKPNDKFYVTPFAFTNPIWVIQDPAEKRTEFIPPAPPPATCRAGVYEPGALLAPGTFDHVGKRLDAVNVPNLLPEEGINAHSKGNIRDLRQLFEVWGGHGH